MAIAGGKSPDHVISLGLSLLPTSHPPSLPYLYHLRLPLICLLVYGFSLVSMVISYPNPHPNHIQKPFTTLLHLIAASFKSCWPGMRQGVGLLLQEADAGPTPRQMSRETYPRTQRVQKRVHVAQPVRKILLEEDHECEKP
mmetsp:Transcript_56219/g.92989  ORF Transcript_56219/g.92989 Transcript_56219/m.92989 type:complete len:141 (+) Transcript_56219:755-1177(+)